MYSYVFACIRTYPDACGVVFFGFSSLLGSLVMSSASSPISISTPNSSSNSNPIFIKVESCSSEIQVNPSLYRGPLVSPERFQWRPLALHTQNIIDMQQNDVQIVEKLKECIKKRTKYKNGSELDELERRKKTIRKKMQHEYDDPGQPATRQQERVQSREVQQLRIHIEKLEQQQKNKNEHDKSAMNTAKKVITAKRQLAIMLGELGNRLREVGDHAGAVNAHSEEVRLSEQLKDITGQARAFRFLAIALQAHRRYSEALKYHMRNLELSLKLGNPLEEYRAHINFSDTLIDWAIASDEPDRQLLWLALDSLADCENICQRVEDWKVRSKVPEEDRNAFDMDANYRLWMIEYHKADIFRYLRLLRTAKEHALDARRYIEKSNPSDRLKSATQCVCIAIESFEYSEALLLVRDEERAIKHAKSPDLQECLQRRARILRCLQRHAEADRTLRRRSQLLEHQGEVELAVESLQMIEENSQYHVIALNLYEQVERCWKLLSSCLSKKQVQLKADIHFSFARLCSDYAAALSDDFNDAAAIRCLQVVIDWLNCPTVIQVCSTNASNNNEDLMKLIAELYEQMGQAYETSSNHMARHHSYQQAALFHGRRLPGQSRDIALARCTLWASSELPLDDKTMWPLIWDGCLIAVELANSCRCTDILLDALETMATLSRIAEDFEMFNSLNALFDYVSQLNDADADEKLLTLPKRELEKAEALEMNLRSALAGYENCVSDSNFDNALMIPKPVLIHDAETHILEPESKSASTSTRSANIAAHGAENATVLSNNSNCLPDSLQNRRLRVVKLHPARSRSQIEAYQNRIKSHSAGSISSTDSSLSDTESSSFDDYDEENALSLSLCNSKTINTTQRYRSLDPSRMKLLRSIAPKSLRKPYHSQRDKFVSSTTSESNALKRRSFINPSSSNTQKPPSGVPFLRDFGDFCDPDAAIDSFSAVKKRRSRNVSKHVAVEQSFDALLQQSLVQYRQADRPHRLVEKRIMSDAFQQPTEVAFSESAPSHLELNVLVGNEKLLLIFGLEYKNYPVSSIFPRIEELYTQRTGIKIKVSNLSWPPNMNMAVRSIDRQAKVCIMFNTNSLMALSDIVVDFERSTTASLLDCYRAELQQQDSHMLSLSLFCAYLQSISSVYSWPREVNICGMIPGIRSVHIGAFLASLRFNKSMRVLRIQNLTILSISIEKWAYGIDQPGSAYRLLTELDIRTCIFNESSLCSTIACIGKLSVIQSLTLRNARWDPEAWTLFTKAMLIVDHLQFLDLSCSSFSDICLMAPLRLPPSCEEVKFTYSSFTRMQVTDVVLALTRSPLPLGFSLDLSYIPCLCGFHAEETIAGVEDDFVNALADAISDLSSHHITSLTLHGFHDEQGQLARLLHHLLESHRCTLRRLDASCSTIKLKPSVLTDHDCVINL